MAPREDSLPGVLRRVAALVLAQGGLFDDGVPDAPSIHGVVQAKDPPDGERLFRTMMQKPSQTSTPTAHAALGSPSYARLDGAGVGVASLCLLHCLVLPSLAALLPFLGAAAEAEWLHRALVLAAFPISGWAVWRRFDLPLGIWFAAGSIAGVAVLSAAIFIEAFEALETHLTVLGGTMLFLTHSLWWMAHRRTRRH